MTLSTRVSIQWPPELAAEKTRTLILASPEGHFVDIRIYKEYEGSFGGPGPDVQHQSLSQPQSQPLPFFGDVFEWCMTGKEVPIPNTNSISFPHVIDSQAIARSIRLGLPLEEGEADVGHFSSIPGSDDRKETGAMTNPATGKVQDYIEIWRSLDPLAHTPEHEVRESKGNTPIPVSVLEVVENPQYQGTVIKYGNWIQGLVYDKENNDVPLHVIQQYGPRTKPRQTVIEYGDITLFPLDFNTELNETTNLKENLVWKRIE